jgi:hypothetical protein
VADRDRGGAGAGPEEELDERAPEESAPADDDDLLPPEVREHLPRARARAKCVYGALGVELSSLAKLAGRPRGFTLPVRDLLVAAGAGFVVATAGDQSLMPGPPSRAAGEAIDVDAGGAIVGLR